MKKKIMAFVFVLLALFTLGACTKTTTTTTRKTRPSRSTTTRYVWTTKTTTTKTYTFLPVDLTGETFTINCASISSGGNYAQNWSNGANVSGYRIGGYRVGSTFSTIQPDDSFYAATPYHGREGAIYNFSPINDIKALVVTYYTAGSYKTTPKAPNITFGLDKKCVDYKYTLEPTDRNEVEVTVNVNGAGFDYFSFNSGDYPTTIKTIEVVYTAGTAQAIGAAAESGKDKVRLNPITYTGVKVPGETKVTVPIDVKYDEATKTYTVIKEKEYTYYTSTYVRNHPEVKDDATMIDPIDVCNYYTIFSTWPANYAEKSGSINVNSIYSIFGKDTRQVSIYNRTDGYATSVPWRGTEKYYELDIDVDGTYSTSGRGSGRVVAWKSGFNATGYDNSPVCLYTDDHYNTWLEYYNNGTWSNRYNGEGNITGVSFSAPTTVILTGFDPKIVEGDPTHAEQGGGGQGQGGGGTGEIPNVQIDDSKYYANYAPATLINEQTAKWQQVTNMSGIVEGNKYMIAFGTGSQTALYFGAYWGAYDGALEYIGSELYKDQYEIKTALYFEKTNGGYYLYSMDEYGYKRYYKFNGNKDGLGYGQGVWQIAFSGGDFYLYVTDNGTNYSLQRNYSSSNGNFFRTYQVGSQSPVQLYRFCDIEGATPPVKPEQFNVDYRYDLVDSAKQIKEKYEYILIYNNDGAVKNLTATNEATYKYDYFDGLQVSEKAEYDTLHFEVHKDKYNTNYYAIYKLVNGEKRYLSYDEDHEIIYSQTPVYFDFNNDSIGQIRLVYINEDEYISPVFDNNDWWFLLYDTDRDDFAFREATSTYRANQPSLYRVIDANHQEQFNNNYERIGSVDSLNSEDEYIFVNDEVLKCLTDDSDATYKFDDYDNLLVSTEAEYEVLHIKKLVNVISRYDGQGNEILHEEQVYCVIYKLVDGVEKYLSYDENFNIVFSTTPAYFMFNNDDVRSLVLVQFDGDILVNLYTDNHGWYLVYDKENGCFGYRNYSYNMLCSIYKVTEKSSGGQGGEDDEYDTNFEHITSLDNISEDDEFIIVFDEDACLFSIDENAKFIINDSDYSLKVTKDALLYPLHFVKKNIGSTTYYEIYTYFGTDKFYLTCSENDGKYTVNFGNDPTPFYVDYDDQIRIIIAEIKDGSIHPLEVNGSWYYLEYDSVSGGFVFDGFDSDKFGQLYKIKKEQQLFSQIEDPDLLFAYNCVIVSKDQKVYLDLGSSASSSNSFEVGGTFESIIAFDIDENPSLYRFENNPSGFLIINYRDESYQPKVVPNTDDTTKCDFSNFYYTVEFDGQANAIIKNPENGKVLRFDGENFKFYSEDNLEGTDPIQIYGIERE